MQENVAFARNRQSLVQEKLKKEGRIYCAKLAVELQVSEHTIRRDLDELSKEGFCRRVHGGAILTQVASGDFDARLEESISSKEALGAACARLLSNGNLVFIDSGTTNLAVAQALPADLDITVVTNSPAIAMVTMSHPKSKTILIGGRIAPHVAGSLGITAQNQIKNMHFDQCILGTCALDPEAGATAHDFEDAEFKQALVTQSGQVIVALTSDKTPGVAKYRITECERISDLVLQSDISEEAIASFQRKGMQVHLAA